MLAFPSRPKFGLKASVLAKVAELFRQLFKVCRNGVIPNLKLCQCLQKMHLTKPIFHESKEHVTVQAPNAGGMIRMVSQKYRDLKADPDKLRTCFGKVFKGSL